MDKPIAAGKSSFDLIDQETFFTRLSLGKDIVLLDLARQRGLRPGIGQAF